MSRHVNGINSDWQETTGIGIHIEKSALQCISILLLFDLDNEIFQLFFKLRKRMSTVIVIVMCQI